MMDHSHEYIRKNEGVCSTQTHVVLNDEGKIVSIDVERGCDGNIQGICSLLIGEDALTAAEKMKGIRCGSRATSCPDQMAQCLEEAYYSFTKR